MLCIPSDHSPPACHPTSTTTSSSTLSNTRHPAPLPVNGLPVVIKFWRKRHAKNPENPCADLVVGLLLIGLLFLINKTRAIDSTLTQEADGKLHIFEEIDTTLDLDVLRSYMGLQQGYAQLAQPVPNWRRTRLPLVPPLRRLNYRGWSRKPPSCTA
ncbi:MAG: hypothetical protein R3E95_09900 [Thiolinea sp.]